MTPPFNPTDYFIAPHASFWQWADYGELAAWSDGRAIAYRPEIESVVAQLATQGLPPFSAVLLVMAACRENWDDSPLRRQLLTDLIDTVTSVSARAGNRSHEDLLHRAMTSLVMVHQAWLQVRDLPYAKSRLAAIIFDGLTGLPTIAAETLAPHLHSSDVTTRQWPLANTLCRAHLLNALSAVYDSLKGTTAPTLVARLKTGVDDVVTAAPVQPLEAIGSARDILSSLQDDPELAGVAELARRVLATLNLPRAVSDPDELPDGGLSDITNRGPLDRLLLSELAHDDLTLSVRVALREALYLRREAPPRTPPKRRAVLIDAGLRMWGVPRVFATAVALALAAHSDNGFDLSIARSAGNEAESVDLRTRAGVLNHLEALDYRAHPAGALATMVKDLNDAAAELVLITTDDVLHDAAFVAALQSLKLSALYIATVGRSGEYHLLVRSSAGTRVLKTAVFDLESILSPRANKPALYAERDPDLQPAINYASPFPLLLSASVHPERAWHASGRLGVMSLSRDGRLLRWSDPGKGAEQLAEHLPSGHVHWAQTVESVVLMVVGPLRKRGLYVVQYHSDRHGGHHCESHALSLGHEHPLAATGHAGLIYVIYKDRCEAFDLLGRRLDEFAFAATMRWERGRFVTVAGNLTERRWCVLGWNGSKIELQQVTSMPKGAESIVSVVEGPTLISADGAATFLQHSDHGERYQFAASTGKGRVSSVSRDERFFLYHADYEREPWPLLVDLERRQSTVYRAKTAPFLEPLLAQYARPRALRHRFSAVGIDEHRAVTLFTSGGAWPIMLAADGNVLLPKRAAPVGKGPRIQFQPCEGEGSYDLRVARWKDGSVAMLDSRGLLHLRSSNADIPECSIVLSEGETAGWVADGRCWGGAYFLGDRPRNSPAEIYQTVLRRFVENLP